MSPAKPAEVAAAMVGDEIVPNADVVMDRAFTVRATPDQVWPWIQQLGKARAGWYFPRWVELVIPRQRRGVRLIEEQWQRLKVGDVIPDYGGKDVSFEVAIIEPPTTLVYRSTRGRTEVSWAISLAALPEVGGVASTRLHFRLRLSPVRHVRLAKSGGELFDLLTIAGMAAGLRERLRG